MATTWQPRGTISRAELPTSDGPAETPQISEGMPCRKSRAKPSEALTSRANYEKKHPPLNNSSAGFSTRPGFQLEGLWRFQWQPEPSQKSDVRFRG